MKNSKRFITQLAFLLAILLLFTFGLSACAESSSDETTIQTVAQTEEREETTKNNVADSGKVLRYIASSESNKYHRPSCHYVDNILYENIIFFYSETSAQRAGYSPCSVCNP